MTIDRAFAALFLGSCLLFAPACGDDGGGGNGGGNPADAAVGIDGDVDSDADPGPDAGPTADPITDLTADYAGPCDQVSLAWTHPAGDGRNGVVVLRRVGAPVEDSLESGTMYTEGEVLPNGAEVILFGDATAFQDAGPFFHRDEVHYAVFARVNGTIYSEGVATQTTADHSLGSQTVTLSIDLSTDAVELTADADFSMQATATFNSGAGTLGIDLSVTNDACRAVHNAKVLASSVNEGGVTVAGDIEVAGTPALYAGVGALAEASSFDSSFLLSNVSGTVDPIEVELEIIDHPTLTLGHESAGAAVLADSSGAGTPVEVGIGGLEFSGLDARMTTGVIDPRGELLYIGHGQQPTIVVVDLATQTAVGSADLTGADNLQDDGTGSIGYVASVAASPDHEFLYAVLVTNQHNSYFCADGNAGACNIGGRVTGGTIDSDVDLVRIDRETLVEVDRLPLLVDVDNEARPGSLSLSADGRRAALPVRREGAVFLLDLETMAIVDGDAGTAGDQPFDVSARSTEPHHAALAPDASEIVIAYRGNGEGGPAHDESLDRIDVATGAITSLAVTTSSGTQNNGSGALLFGPDGRLYYGRKDGTVGLSVFDLAGNSEVELLSAETLRAMAFDSTGSHLFVWDGAAVQRFDLSNDTLVNFEATGDALFFVDSSRHHGAITEL